MEVPRGEPGREPRGGRGRPRGGRGAVPAAAVPRGCAVGGFYRGSDELRGGGCAGIAGFPRVVQRAGVVLHPKETPARRAAALAGAGRRRAARRRRGRGEFDMSIPAESHGGGHAGADAGVSSVGDGPEPRRGLQSGDFWRGVDGADRVVRVGRAGSRGRVELSVVVHPVLGGDESRGRSRAHHRVHCGTNPFAAAAGAGARAGLGGAADGGHAVAGAGPARANPVLPRKQSVVRRRAGS